MAILPHQNGSTVPLHGKVALLINGLSELGGRLAEMLARRGTDIVIVDARSDMDLAGTIQQKVDANGRRCLILRIGPETSANATPAQDMAQLMNLIGKPDLFITLGGEERATPQQATTGGSKSTEWRGIFDKHGLTMAVLRRMFAG